MASLADEKERWEAGSETFKSQMSTISGDVLLTSAFMAYGGTHTHIHTTHKFVYIYIYIYSCFRLL